MSNDLAVTLTILRAVRQWTQGDLADAARVTKSAISDYERGKADPQTQTLQRLLRALGLPLSALDQTQEFILRMRAQLDPGPPGGDADAPPDADGLPTSGERELRIEMGQLAAEGGRFTSRLLHLILQLLAKPK